MEDMAQNVCPVAAHLASRHALLVHPPAHLPAYAPIQTRHVAKLDIRIRIKHLLLPHLQAVICKGPHMHRYKVLLGLVQLRPMS